MQYNFNKIIRDINYVFEIIIDIDLFTKQKTKKFTKMSQHSNGLRAMLNNNGEHCENARH